MYRHLVITVHGIRTFGQWQERLERLLKTAEPSVHVLNYKFGYFSAIAFSIPLFGRFFRWMETRRFQTRVLKQLDVGEWARIDIVAHSFGTHLVAWALHGIKPQARPRINTLILAGSVLKTFFPWYDLLGRSVDRLVNECGIHDSVLMLNRMCVLGTGMAGLIGFGGPTGDKFRNRYWKMGHSGFFERQPGDDDRDTFMKQQWLPLITSDIVIAPFDDRPPLSVLGGVGMFALNNAEPLKLLAVALLLGAPLLWYYTLYRSSEEQRLIAVARYLASESEQFSESDPQRGLLLGVEGLQVVPQARFDPVAAGRQLAHRMGWAWSTESSPVSAAEQALRNRLARARGIALEAFEEPILSIEVSGDGGGIVAVGQRGSLKLWTRDGRRRFSKVVDTHVGESSSAIAISPDFRSALTGASDGRVRLWKLSDAARPLQSVVLAVFSSRVTDVTFSADGRRIAAASEDGDVHVWSRASEASFGEPIRLTMPRHGRHVRVQSFGVTRLSFSDDGNLTVSTPHASVHLWPVGHGGFASEPIVLLSPDQAWTPIGLVKTSLDGRWIAIGGGSQEGGFLFDIDATRKLKSRDVVGSGVFRTTGLAFSRKQLLATVSREDDSVAVWGLDTAPSDASNRHRQLLRAFDGGQAVALTDHWLATGSRDHAVRVRRISHDSDAREVRFGVPLALRGHGDEVTSVAISDDGATMVSGARDGTVHAWTLSADEMFSADGLEPRSLPGKESGMPIGGSGFPELGSGRGVGRFAFSADGRFITDLGRHACVWTLDAPAVASSCGHVDTDRFTRSIVSAGGRWLMRPVDIGIRLTSLGGDGEIIDLPVPQEAGRRVASVVTSANDRWIAAVTESHIVVWNITSAHASPSVLPFTRSQRPPSFIEFSADSRRLVTAADVSVEVRDLDSPTRAPRQIDLGGVGTRLTDLKVSLDGRWLAGGGSAGKIAFVSLESQQPAESHDLPQIMFTPVGAVTAFSRDGRWLAAGGSSETVSVWSIDASGFKRRRLLHGNRGGVRSLSFSSDGDRLFAATASKQVRVWRLNGIGAGESIVLPYTGHVVDRLIVSPGGQWLAAHDVDDVVHVWPLDPKRLVQRARHFVGRNLRTQEWLEYFPAVPYRRTFVDLPSSNQ